MIRRRPVRPGLLAALMAMIFAMGAFTASFACSVDAAGAATVSMPVYDDGCPASPKTSCVQSCVAICHAVTPPTSTITPPPPTTEVQTRIEADLVAGLANGPEPPPPRPV